ncbi:MATE family efflux transporter [bacterium]|nr:MATE family efflux transporter [bacterium]MBU1433638.1 MATE family efflux transporter [bacterium]MBU1503181.1 MATE family efflux transporter [bacterium]
MREVTKFLPTYKNIWLVSFPMIIASISETVVVVTDAIFLSHYGMTELAALGIADTIYALSLFFILGFVDGIQITIGRRAGEEAHKKIGLIINQGFYILSFISMLMILFILFVLPYITFEIFQSQDIHQAVALYLNIAIFGLFFHALNLALSAFYVGISKTKVFIGATIVLAITNILLDYFLIFGHYGFPEMGIAGAGIASLSAEIAVFLFLFIDILRRKYIQNYGLFVFEKLNFPLIKTLTKLSLPVSMEALIQSLRWFLFFLIIEQLGEESLAVATIIFSCYLLLQIPINAFSETVCSMASNLIGQKDEKEVAQLVSKTIKLSYIALIPMLLALAFFPEYVLAIFSSEEALIQMASAALFVIIITTIVAVPADIMASTVAGTGDTMVTFFIELAVSVSVLFYVYWAALVAGYSHEYIWIGELIGWIVCLSLSWLWLRSGYWKRLNI